MWIVDSSINTPVARRMRKKRSGENSLTGITTFRPTFDMSPEDELVAMLDTIELHHGEYSADPPYSIREIFGCGVSDRVRAALAEFDFSPEASSTESIVAVRTQ